MRLLANGMVSFSKLIMLSWLLVTAISMTVPVEAVAGAGGPMTPVVAGEDCDCEGVSPHPCGPACLGFVLKHFGVDRPGGSQLGDAADDARGIGQIQTVCVRAGLQARRVRLDVSRLENLLCIQPDIRAILVLKSDHLGYVEAASNGRFCLVTLSDGPNWRAADTLAGCWPGEALVISRQTLPADLVDLAVEGKTLPAERSPLRVVYFHSPTCQECRRVKQFLPQVTGRWGNRIAIEFRSVDDIDVFSELFKYEKHYNVTVAAPPAIFVGDKALVGEDAIIKQLDSAIADARANGIATFSLEAASPSLPAAAQQEAVPSEILSRFKSFAPGAVAVAGLIDGVNPCAFTTIVFFLSMLAYLKKTRREMLLVGMGFTAGMFATYFLLGLGLLGAVKSFSVSHGLSSGLACVVAFLAFALAAWSLIDAVRYIRSGETKQMTLGLPTKVRDRIHKVIRGGLTTRGLVIGSVTIGFLVSILESLCTGQVYLPTIVFMTRSTDMKTTAVAYLLLYNVMFILPLAGILAMTYLGVRSETLGMLLKKRLAAMKLTMAALFAGLGLLIVVTL